MAGFILLSVSLLSLGGFASGMEKEMTVNIEAGKEECFFETVPKSNTLTVEYQVIDGGSGQMSELDVSFRLVDPKGKPLLAEFKKPDGAHTIRAVVSCNLYKLYSVLIRASVSAQEKCVQCVSSNIPKKTH